jgi:NAD(P)-dependent dehydrogenase (short-subunit alcohol dehydrogenase family)
MRFSQVLAHQVKAYGVNVNCLGVGAQTRMWYDASAELARVRGTDPPPPIEEMPEENRVLAHENVGAFVFLASSLSDHVTGAYFEANQLPAHLRRLA